MKKTILVTATLTVEGDNLDSNFFKKLLKRLNRHFMYKFKYETRDSVLVRYEISENYIEIER